MVIRALGDRVRLIFVSIEIRDRPIQEFAARKNVDVWLFGIAIDSGLKPLEHDLG